MIRLSVSALMLFGCSSCDRQKQVKIQLHPEAIVYAIPEGYAGWLSISFGVTEAPPLSVQDGNLVAVFPESGIIETSTSMIRPPSRIDVYRYYNTIKSWSINHEKEYGGGITEKDSSTQVAVYKFWVSRNTRRDFPIYVKDRVIQPGPFPDYAPPI